MITEALISLRPGARFILVGDTLDGLEWLDQNQTCPSVEEITAEVARLQTLKNNTQYQIDRAKEYPSIGDQLDALFHAGVFPPEMAARIQAVKDQYPKQS
jgi:hypothetical protein